MTFIPISVIVTATIGGKAYPVVDVQITYAVGLIATGVVTLAIGKNLQTGAVSAPVSFPRGTPAVVSVTVRQQVTSPGGAQMIKAGTTKMFNGLVDSDGPISLAFGQYGVQVQLAGTLKRLDTGTLQSSDVQPKSYLDTTHPIPYLKYNDSMSNLPGDPMKSLANPDGGGDLWGALKEYMGQIANTGAAGSNKNADQSTSLLLGQYLTAIGATGTRPNVQAAEELSKIGGKLQLISLPGVNRAFRFVALQSLNQERYHSFFSMINDLGFFMSFRLIENPTGTAVVPFLPFSLSGNQFKTIDAGSVLSISKVVRDPMSYSGCVLVAGGNNVNLATKAANFIPGSWMRPPSPGQTDLLGFPLSEVAPPFLFRDTELAQFKETTAQNSGTYVGDILGTEAGANPKANTMGNRYARHHCLEVNSRGHAASITCPLRFDLGLLTPVKFSPPSVGGVPAGAPSYGVVTALHFSISTQQRTAQTTVEIGYLRSEDRFNVEQTGPLTAHPFWTSTYTGKRFDDAPA